MIETQTVVPSRLPDPRQITIGTLRVAPSRSKANYDRVTMPLKGAKTVSYKQKHYFENKDIISTRKKEAYYEDLDKSHEESAACSKTNYDKHPDSGAKSTARSGA